MAINLAQREKRLIGFMMLVMIGLVSFMTYQKVYKALAVSQVNLVQAQDNLLAARMFRETIISEREGQKVIQVKLNARARSFDLYNFSNKCLAELKLADRTSLQSVGLSSNDKAFDGVQITMKNISMKELIDLLHTMYSSNNLIMMQEMTYLRPSRDKKGLECSLKMLSPKR